MTETPAGLRRRLGSWRRSVRRYLKRSRTRLRLEHAARFGPLPAPEKWVFLVGCYNSGTTLLHDLLATHDAIGSMPDEGQFFTDQLPVPRELGLRRLWALEPRFFHLTEASDPGIDLDRLLRQWGARFNHPSRPVLIEKTPTNAARTRWLQARFPSAHFIGILRDGRAVAEGIRRKTGHPLDLAARQWARSNEIMLRDFEHLQRKRLVTYESLTADPAQVMAELLEFLGLPPMSADLQNREWKIHEQRSSIRNMNAQSIRALSPEDLAIIELEAAAMMKTLGYTSVSSP